MASGITQFAIQKLNSENYSVWSYKLQLLLIKEKLWEVIEKEKPALADVAWVQKDNEARATIGLLVEDSQLHHIRTAKTAREAWLSLKGYHQKATLTNKVLLLKQLCRTSMRETGDMEEHITKMSGYFEKLTALGQELPDNLMGAMLLGSLPESYETLVTALETRSEKEFTLELVKGKLMDEYKRRKGAQDTRESTETALKAEHKNKDNIQPKKSCYFCKKPGYFKNECAKYKAWKHKKEKANTISEEPTNNYCFYAKANISEEVFIGAEKQKNLNTNAWIVDSGATSHMAITRSFFHEFDAQRKGKVCLADEAKIAEVHGIGSGIIHCTTDSGKVTDIKIHDVLYVPSLGSNLLSVKKLVKDGYRLIFDERQCSIVKNGKLQAIAKLSPEFYCINEIEKVCTAGGFTNSGHTEDCVHMWHRRFGHRDVNAIKFLEHKDLATGIRVKNCGQQIICECCVKGKMARVPFPKETKSRTYSTLDLVHTDVCGPMQTVTPGNKRYILTIIDDYSRFSTIYLLSHKNETTKCLKEFIEMVKTQFGKKPKIIRSDRGTEYVNKDLRGYLKQKGIRVQYTAAYSPQQNGVAERKNRSLLEMARCMLLDANLEKRYWGEAVNTANYLQNRLPTRAIQETPYELWFTKKPDVGNLHIFGCEAYIHIHKEQRKKLDDKAEKLIFVGYSDESKAFRLLDIKTNRIKISRDVVFLDEVNGNRINPAQENEVTFSRKMDSTIENDYKDSESIISDEESSSEEDTLTGDITSEEYASCPEESDRNEKPEETTCRQSQRSNKGVPPDRYMDFSNLANSEEAEPTSIREAMTRPDKDRWKEAMDDEINSLNTNDTWEIVPKPKDANIVSCKWVFKIKKNTDGSVERYKARLVARGFSQKYGTDYDEVFAPVVRQATFRTFLTIAGQEGMTVKHFDAKTAFLNGRLVETIYMRQPEGYIVPGNEDHVCKLKKGIYGLKQAAKVWNDQLNSLFKSFNFRQSQADACLYIKKDKKEEIYVIVYVDDILIAAKDTTTIDRTAQHLRKNFNLNDLGALKHYLGMEIRKNKEGFYCLSQKNYINKILQRFGLQDAKGSSVPLDQGYLKHKSNDSVMPNTEKYQQLIGALLYVATNTRPDICASIAILSQRIKNPTTNDWTEAKRVARYLKQTQDYELKLGQRVEHKKLVGFADADWAHDSSDRKSNSGFLFQFAGSSISWGCRKQACVSLSSTEAEYVALSEATQEGIWIQRLLEEFGQNTRGTIIYEDNQSCLKLILNNRCANRTKHIDTKFHFVREIMRQGKIDYLYCPSEEMTADMLTKPLGKVKLKYMAEKSGLFQRMQ